MDFSDEEFALKQVISEIPEENRSQTERLPVHYYNRATVSNSVPDQQNYNLNPFLAQNGQFNAYPAVIPDNAALANQRNQCNNPFLVHEEQQALNNIEPTQQELNRNIEGVCEHNQMQNFEENLPDYRILPPVPPRNRNHPAQPFSTQSPPIPPRNLNGRPVLQPNRNSLAVQSNNRNYGQKNGNRKRKYEKI